MNTNDLRIGDKVHCPPDRGDNAYVGTVTHIAPTLCTHACLEKPFIWVTVRHPDFKSSAVWPSNRLGIEVSV